MSAEEPKIRSFKISGSDIGFEGGRYLSDEGPKKAANRAGSALFKAIDNKQDKPGFRKYKKFQDHKIIKFILTESTQGSKKESKYYEASRIPLKTPKTVVRNGVSITYEFKIVVKEHIGSPASLPKFALKQN